MTYKYLPLGVNKLRLCIHVYLYIDIDRLRQMHICISVYTYAYIYIERELHVHVKADVQKKVMCSAATRQELCFAELVCLHTGTTWLNPRKLLPSK